LTLQELIAACDSILKGDAMAFYEVSVIDEPSKNLEEAGAESDVIFSVKVNAPNPETAGFKAALKMTAAPKEGWKRRVVARPLA